MAASLTKMVTDTVFDLCDASLVELISDYKRDMVLSSIGEAGQIESAVNALERARARIKEHKENVK